MGQTRKPTTEQITALRDYVNTHFDQVVEDLRALVRIPSVSNPAFDQAHVEESAAWVAQSLRQAGLDDVRILRGKLPDGQPAAPAVVARTPAPAGAPTVLLYAHHDVQPPGPDEEWLTHPFEPRRIGERLTGRGAADDKAGVVAHLGALRALRATGDGFPVGITVFVEGEEEIGSPSFGDFLVRYRDLLEADVIVVADSANWRVGVPTLTTSLRGVVDCVVEVSVLEHAIHSGFFGGPVPDAITCLSRLIATLHDDAGNVAVAGVASAGEPEIDMAEEDLRRDASVLPGVELIGEGSLTGRIWSKPAISVLGFDAPSVQTASGKIIASARAKISMRVAPGQDPREALDALREHLLSHAPFHAQVNVVDGQLGRSFVANRDSAAMTVARDSFATAWERDVVEVGIGASIPFIADLVEVFPGAAILVTGVEDPDSRAHSANESVHLGDLQRTVLAEAMFLLSCSARDGLLGGRQGVRK